MEKYDAVILGAGVIGCAVARELSRYEGSFCVLERQEDVCCGTSKANSAIIHAGYDAVPGTWMAKMNVTGNRMMDQISRELDVPFQRIGSLVVCFQDEEKKILEELYERGLENQVEGLALLNGEQARAMEPGLSQEVKGALYAPTGGIVCPFELTLAFGENAVENGVRFFFDSHVDQVKPAQGGYVITAGSREIYARAVINAAGVYADVFHNMVSSRKLHITPRRGEYCLLDKEAGNLISHTIFQVPGPYGKGVLVTPTVHGNLLVGPNAQDLQDKEEICTTEAGLEEVLKKGSRSLKKLPAGMIITSFAGLRAHEAGDDFVLGQPEDAPGFFDGAGIASPGLSSAPAIGSYLAEQAASYLQTKKKQGFNPMRKGIIHTQELSIHQWQNLIKKDPAYGIMICRCEKVTEGEIVAAVRSPLGARSLDGVKRRTRSGMGRCQGGFCAPRVMEILGRELHMDVTELTKAGGDSRMLTGKTGEDAGDEL